MSDRDFEQLIKDTTLDDQSSRITAIYRLAEMRDVRAYDTFVKILHSDDAAGIRSQAVRGLGMLGTANAIKTLVGALSDHHAGVRLSAAEQLGFIIDGTLEQNEYAVMSLLQVLNDDEEDVRMYAASSLGRIGTSTYRLLSDLLKDNGATERAKAYAIWALAFIDDEIDIVPDILEMLHTDSQIIRENALKILHLRADPRSKDTIAKLTNDPVDSIRLAAQKTLSRLDSFYG